MLAKDILYFDAVPRKVVFWFFLLYAETIDTALTEVF